MQLSESLGTLHEFDYEDDTERFLYDSMMSEYESVLNRRSTVFFENLWASLAPAGNIYRYVGLQSECLRHSFDIGAQVDALAAEHGRLLTGAASPAGELREALKRATVRRRDKPDPHGHPAGFKPVEEFLTCPVVNFGILIPRDLAGFREWLTLRFIICMIFAIQVGIPLIILIDEWYQPSKGMDNFRRFIRRRDVGEFICLGRDLRETLHTIMGGILLWLVLLIIHSYALDQRENSFKSGCIATDRFWYTLGHCTNMWCCVVTALAVPVRFWDESDSTSIAMDSLTLLFIFMLDDLVGYAATYLGKTDMGFQRAAAWQAALLTQCPVDLRDIVNPDAKTIDELWCISFDSLGRLEAVQADPPNLPQAPPKLCTRRLMRVRSEASALLSAASRPGFFYAWSTTGGTVLPRVEARVLPHLWLCVDLFFVGFQVVAPLLWMLVNKPCAG